VLLKWLSQPRHIQEIDFLAVRKARVFFYISLGSGVQTGLLTTNNNIRFQASSCAIFTVGIPCQYISTNASHLYFFHLSPTLQDQRNWRHPQIECTLQANWTMLLQIISRLLHSITGHAVVQLVEALRYKTEGRGFDSRCCHWNFSFT